ncbi:MAG: ABC transporter permease [Bacteroidales bacterium]|nr:ABC transporter permease [Bacteroidales bacterium]
MKDYLKLAWRNIWRNKRRTIITVASIFFAMFFALVMRALQVGSYGHMTNNIVQAFTGYIQIHKYGYWDDQTLDNTFEYNDSFIQEITAIEQIKTVIPRLESFALASTGVQTKGIAVVGIDPELEKGLTQPHKKIVEGKYLDKTSDGVLISGRLAEFLNLKLGDTVTLLSVGYHGASAAGIFPVVGILNMPNPELDRRLIFMNLATAQNFYGAENMLTSLVINLYDSDDLNKTKRELANLIDPIIYETMDWKELNPELVQQIQSDQGGGYIMLGMLYLIVGFGVMGTLIMMTTERRREFGVMVSIGMQKKRLGGILTVEMIMMGIIGIITGIVGSLPVILYLVSHPIRFTGETAEIFESYGFEPIMPAVLESGYMIAQSLVVLLIFSIAIIYPIISVIKINEIKALRN